MLITAEQVLILFLFIVVGFALAKTGIVEARQAKILSALEVYFSFPACTSTIFQRTATFHTWEKNIL